MSKILTLILFTALSKITMADSLSRRCHSSYCPGDYLQVRGGGICRGTVSTCTTDGCVNHSFLGDSLDQASCDDDIAHMGSRLEVLSRAESWSSSILVRITYSKPGYKSAPVGCEGFIRSDCVLKISQ